VSSTCRLSKKPETTEVSMLVAWFLPAHLYCFSSSSRLHLSRPVCQFSRRWFCGCFSTACLSYAIWHVQQTTTAMTDASLDFTGPTSMRNNRVNQECLTPYGPARELASRSHSQAHMPSTANSRQREHPAYCHRSWSPALLPLPVAALVILSFARLP
jgi:hypothetical protein